ncbi:Os05g0316050, partial [Oryza sativa Japonica Group]
MLPYEDDEQQQREWQYLLDPPRDMVHVIPLVGAVPTPVPGRAVRAPTTRLRVGAATPPRGSRGRVNVPGGGRQRRGRPRLRGAGAGGDDAGVLEQRSERGLQEAGGGESEAVAAEARRRGGPTGARAGPGTPAMIGGASRRWLHRRRQRRR